LTIHNELDKKLPFVYLGDKWDIHFDYKELEAGSNILRKLPKKSVGLFKRAIRHLHAKSHPKNLMHSPKMHWHAI
jgi:hypothetical protein